MSALYSYDASASLNLLLLKNDIYIYNIFIYFFLNEDILKVFLNGDQLAPKPELCFHYKMLHFKMPWQKTKAKFEISERHWNSKEYYAHRSIM